MLSRFWLMIWEWRQSEKKHKGNIINMIIKRKEEVKSEQVDADLTYHFILH